jgi:hypothetical protein
VPVPSGPCQRRGGGFRGGACNDRAESILSKRPAALAFGCEAGVADVKRRASAAGPLRKSPEFAGSSASSKRRRGGAYACSGRPRRWSPRSATVASSRRRGVSATRRPQLLVVVQLDTDDSGRPGGCSAYESDSGGALAGGNGVSESASASAPHRGRRRRTRVPAKRNSELIVNVGGRPTARATLEIGDKDGGRVSGVEPRLHFRAGIRDGAAGVAAVSESSRATDGLARSLLLVARRHRCRTADNDRANAAARTLSCAGAIAWHRAAHDSPGGRVVAPVAQSSGSSR